MTMIDIDIPDEIIAKELAWQYHHLPSEDKVLKEALREVIRFYTIRPEYDLLMEKNDE